MLTYPLPRCAPASRAAAAALAFWLFAAGNPLSAKAPDSLSLTVATDPSMGVTHASAGLLTVELPGGGAVYLAPRLVDQASGTWQGAKEVRNFSAAEGREVTSSASFSWEEGAQADLTFSAASALNKVRVKLSWRLQGDASGHIRLDMLIPFDLAEKMLIEGGEGKILFEDGKSGAAWAPGPLRVTDKATGKEIFTIEGDVPNAAVRVDHNYEKNGIELRLSSYRPGGKNSLSEQDQIEFDIVFPK